MIHISYFFKSDYNVQSYLLVEIFIGYLLFDIDSKFDYHGTIGD